jgi:hypothetical protein
MNDIMRNYGDIIEAHQIDKSIVNVITSLRSFYDRVTATSALKLRDCGADDGELSYHIKTESSLNDGELKKLELKLRLLER